MWEVDCGKYDCMACFDNNYSTLQVEIPNFQSRFLHSAAAFLLCPGLTEVVIFGGCPEALYQAKLDGDYSLIANTTLLQFG